jgi:isopenicillin-N N-acyltransferase-like protein
LRDRVTRYSCLLLIAASLSFAVPQQVTTPSANPAGHWEQVDGLRIVYLHGSPYEMGLQLGTLFREPLRQFVADYLYGHILAERGMSPFALLNFVRLLEPGLPPDLCREMQGIAEGAGVSYTDVLLLNIVPDLLALTRKLPVCELASTLLSASKQRFVMAQSAAASDARTGAALNSSFAAWGSATETGELVLGHNLYAKDADLLAPYVLLTVRQPSHGNAFASLGLMGMVGVQLGMNEEKVVVSLAGAPSIDVASQGQPLPFLLRLVLQHAGDLGEAEGILLEAPRLYGGNAILGDGKVPEAIAIELSAHRQAIDEADPSSTMLARTDSFLSPGLRWTQPHVPGDAEATGSEVRLSRLLTMLQMNSGWISQEKSLAFLKDDQDTQLGGRQGLDWSPRLTDTLHSALLLPGQFALWVMQRQDSALESNSTYPPVQYVELDLSLSLSAPSDRQ